jgi:hypothetical protein
LRGGYDWLAVAYVNELRGTTGAIKLHQLIQQLAFVGRQCRSLHQ